MTRIRFDAYCPSCDSDVVILEGNPMVCPKCHADIEVRPIMLEPDTGRTETENPIPVSNGKEVDR